MNYQQVIEDSIQQIEKDGIQIIIDNWGIYNNGKKWICLEKQCCPLGAVLLSKQIIYPRSYFIDYLQSVSLSPEFAICKFFGVDSGWLKSFIHGMFNQQIGGCSNLDARNLGFQFYQKYKGK
jgi:hypothetical protein